MRTPKECNPGTFAARNGSGTCTMCAAGRFQTESGSTACDECSAGSFCPEGAAAALPCPGGTFSSTLGLPSADFCQSVGPGFWAPTGSAQPEPCPASGFYCPGRDADKVNNVSGSKPILVAVGAVTEEVEQVERRSRVVATLTLEQDLALKREDSALLRRP